jgi:dipeptidyl aminopeptidase/acylaminoacyl peptidase
VLEDGAQPNEIWAGAIGGEPRQITAFNQALLSVTLGEVETIRWHAPDGLAIEGVLIHPAGYEAGRRYPLIVLAHGGPTWQWTQRFMANWHDWGQWLAAHGYAVLLPNPRGSTGRGRDFAHRNRRAWGSGDLDDCLSGVDQLVSQGLADPERLGIGGWSYGGFMTSWAIGHTHRFKAAIVGAGVTNLLSFQASDIPSWLPAEQMQANPYNDSEIYLRCSPISYAANITTPTLILHGASDERVRPGQGRELYNALRYLKVPAEMVVYPRETHAIMERHHQRDMLDRIAAWYDRWLKS